MLTKKDVKEIVTDIVKDAASQILDVITRGFDSLENRMGKMEVDIKDIKRDINDLKADTPTPQEFRDHEKRINKLEQSVFPS